MAVRLPYGEGREGVMIGPSDLTSYYSYYNTVTSYFGVPVQA